MSSSSIAERLKDVQARVVAAARRVKRDPASVTLIAVSKTHPAAMIREAYAAGARDFGENYVQELRAKRAELGDLKDARWHFIGGLQKNKAKDVVGHAVLVHAVDNLELAQILAKRGAQGGISQDVLVEVNLAGEDSKGGIAPPQLPGLLASMSTLDGVRCVGLMAIPPPAGDPEDNREHFRSLAALAHGHHLTQLSMGMSDDFEVAIEEGATHVRVGTAIFGKRAKTDD